MGLIQAYQFAHIPKVVFGQGTFKQLPNLVRSYGTRVLIVTGGQSFKKTHHYAELLRGLEDLQCQIKWVEVVGEPSINQVDRVVEDYRNMNALPDVVVAIGGGSVIDAGKAISAMMKETESVKMFLEIVGTLKPSGMKIPFIAVPTTSGTGAEATKNAVISDVGIQGFKCSLRHENYVPDVAMVDPELMLSVPRDVTAACGLDALTQLLEAYVSTQASPVTDALAWSGLQYFKSGFESTLDDGEKDVNARAAVAHAALMSGIVLANAGLGVVHGFASQIGAYYPIPHGVVCAALLPACTKINLRELWKHEILQVQAIEKYADVGRVLCDTPNLETRSACENLIIELERLVAVSKIKKLSAYGLTLMDVDKILAGTDVKNGPVKLNSDHLREILQQQL